MSPLKKIREFITERRKNVNRKSNLLIITGVYNNGIRNNCLKRLEFRRKHK